MPSIEVFDPAMCCTTGVCGPEVDPDLARFADDLAWARHPRPPMAVVPIVAEDPVGSARLHALTSTSR